MMSTIQGAGCLPPTGNKRFEPAYWAASLEGLHGIRWIPRQPRVSAPYLAVGLVH